MVGSKNLAVQKTGSIPNTSLGKANAKHTHKQTNKQASKQARKQTNKHPQTRRTRKKKKEKQKKHARTRASHSGEQTHTRRQKNTHKQTQAHASKPHTQDYGYNCTISFSDGSHKMAKYFFSPKFSGFPEERCMTEWKRDRCLHVLFRSPIPILSSHRWSFGKLGGPGKWNKRNLNQCHLFLTKPT